jgi:hypothetical protein|tara:strand:+ start:4524 stop:4769 length:246 start_codon:yes stop_codon:yes gene_type:complete
MATKKKSTPNPEDTSPSPSEEEINILINDSYQKGKEDGLQDAWRGVAAFIEERMHQHFGKRQDDLARELREILFALNKNIT